MLDSLIELIRISMQDSTVDRSACWLADKRWLVFGRHTTVSDIGADKL